MNKIEETISLIRLMLTKATENTTNHELTNGLYQKLDDLQDDLVDLRSANKRLNEKQENQGEFISKLENDLSSKNDELQNLEKELRKKVKEIEENRKQLELIEQGLIEKDDELLEENRKEIQRLKLLVSRNERELQAKEDLLNQKEDSFSASQAEIEKQKKSYGELNTKFVKESNEVSKLREETEELKNEVNLLKKEREYYTNFFSQNSQASSSGSSHPPSRKSSIGGENLGTILEQGDYFPPQSLTNLRRSSSSGSSSSSVVATPISQNFENSQFGIQQQFYTEELLKKEKEINTLKNSISNNYESKLKKLIESEDLIFWEFTIGHWKKRPTQKTYNELQSILETTRNENENERIQAANELTEAKEEINKLTSEFETKSENLQNELDQVISERNSQKKAFEILAENVDGLQATSKHWQDQTIDLEVQIRNLEGELATKTTESESKLAELEALMATLEETRIQRDSHWVALGIGETRSQAQAEEILQLRSENENLQNQLTSHQEQLEKIQQEKSELENNLQTEWDKLDNALAQKEEELAQRANINQTEYEDELITNDELLAKKNSLITQKNLLLAAAQSNLSQLIRQKDILLYENNLLQQRPSRGAYQQLKNKKTRQKEYSIKQINNLNQKLNNAYQKVNNLAGELATERINHANTQTQLTNANNAVITAQNHLGVNNLNNLSPLPTGQTLNALIQAYNNHLDYETVRGERDNYLTELNELEHDFRQQENLLADKNAKLATAIAEKNNLQTQLTNERNTNQGLRDQINQHHCPTLAPHTCPPCDLIHLPEPHICPIVKQADCSHSDYEDLKTKLHAIPSNWQQQIAEANLAQQQAKQEIDNKENQITQQFVAELQLDAEQNDTIKKVIQTVKELINKPPIYWTTNDNLNELTEELNQAQQTITKLEQELKDQDTPFGEDLEAIKQLELSSLKELFSQAIDTYTQQQIQQATNYQELATARQACIQRQLNQKQALTIISPNGELAKPINQEKVILIGLLIASLFTISGLLANKRRKAK